MLKTINGGISPSRGSKYSACIDLYARENVVIGAGETVKVPLGVCIDLDKLTNKLLSYIEDIYNQPDSVIQEFLDSDHWKKYFNEFLSSHYLQLEPRSSLRAKGLQGNTGIIDIDYEDEIMIILHNPVGVKQFVENGCNYTVLEDADDVEYKIKKGDKIAQILLCVHESHLFDIETEEERCGGFGSTDN